MNHFRMAAPEFCELLDSTLCRELGLETITASFRAEFARDYKHDRISVSH